MKGTEVRRRVENPRRQRQSVVFGASNRQPTPALCLPIYSGDLGLHSIPNKNLISQYRFL